MELQLIGYALLVWFTVHFCEFISQRFFKKEKTPEEKKKIFELGIYYYNKVFQFLGVNEKAIKNNIFYIAILTIAINLMRILVMRKGKTLFKKIYAFTTGVVCMPGAMVVCAFFYVLGVAFQLFVNVRLIFFYRDMHKNALARSDDKSAVYSRQGFNSICADTLKLGFLFATYKELCDCQRCVDHRKKNELDFGKAMEDKV